jgi:hypothetical protein
VSLDSRAGRSKTPRGRPDPLDEIAEGGRVHLVPDLEVLEQDRAELDEPKGCLAPGDDGVHTGTIAVVGADAAIAVAVKRCGIAAGAAVPFAGDQIDERRFLGLLHESLSSVGGRIGVARDEQSGRAAEWIPWAAVRRGGFREYTV